MFLVVSLLSGFRGMSRQLLYGKARVIIYAPQPCLLSLIIYDRISRHEFNPIGVIILIVGVFSVITSVIRAVEAWNGR